jgi:hypothetical protein
MTHADRHPEHLLDRLRSGSICREACRRLRAHCAECVCCSLELRLAIDGSMNALPDETDRALGQAALERVLGQSGSTPPGWL